MGEVRAAQVQTGWPAAGGPADTLEIPSPRLGAAHPDPLGDVADNGMQYGRGQPLPPWAAAIPGRHGGRDAHGVTFTAAHEVNSRRAMQLPATRRREHDTPPGSHDAVRTTPDSAPSLQS